MSKPSRSQIKEQTGRNLLAAQHSLKYCRSILKGRIPSPLSARVREEIESVLTNINKLHDRCNSKWFSKATATAVKLSILQTCMAKIAAAVIGRSATDASVLAETKTAISQAQEDMFSAMNRGEIGARCKTLKGLTYEADKLELF